MIDRWLQRRFLSSSRYKSAELYASVQGQFTRFHQWLEQRVAQPVMLYVFVGVGLLAFMISGAHCGMGGYHPHGLGVLLHVICPPDVAHLGLATMALLFVCRTSEQLLGRWRLAAIFVVTSVPLSGLSGALGVSGALVGVILRNRARVELHPMVWTMLLGLNQMVSVLTVTFFLGDRPTIFPLVVCTLLGVALGASTKLEAASATKASMTHP